MIYIALLRGINVGGNNKVDMKQLKATFEQTGMKSVTTYINSGNVVFADDSHEPAILVTILENTVEQTFGFAVKVLLRDVNNLKSVIEALPSTWQNDDTMKCDVMFLWEDVDSPEVLEGLSIKPAIDEVKYVPGAILWRVDRDKITRSGMMKLVGTKLYKQMTIRNCNTVRKLLQLALTQ